MFTAYRNLTLALLRLVNAPRGQNSNQYRSNILLKASQKADLITAGRLAVERKLAHASTGEISLRLQTSQLAINTRASDLYRLTDADFVACAVTSPEPVETAPDHLLWHQLIYQAAPAQSVLFCQPFYTALLANAATLPRETIAPEIFKAVGGVLLVQHTDVKDDFSAKTVNDHHAFMIPGIGAIVWGTSPFDAIHRAEALEYVGRLTVMTRQIGIEVNFDIPNSHRSS